MILCATYVHLPCMYGTWSVKPILSAALDVQVIDKMGISVFVRSQKSHVYSWDEDIYLYTEGDIMVMSLTRAKWISFRGSHWVQGMVHLSVVTLISSNCQEIPHHCISLHHRESNNISIMCKHSFCVTFDPWCNSCGLFLIDMNRKWTPTSTSRSCVESCV